MRVQFSLLAITATLWILMVPSVNCQNGLPRIHVDASTGHFVDEFGRVRIFRGVNSVKKAHPWYEVGARQMYHAFGHYKAMNFDSRIRRAMIGS